MSTRTRLLSACSRFSHVAGVFAAGKSACWCRAIAWAVVTFQGGLVAAHPRSQPLAVQCRFLKSRPGIGVSLHAHACALKAKLTRMLPVHRNGVCLAVLAVLASWPGLPVAGETRRARGVSMAEFKPLLSFRMAEFKSSCWTPRLASSESSRRRTQWQRSALRTHAWPTAIKQGAKVQCAHLGPW